MLQHTTLQNVEECSLQRKQQARRSPDKKHHLEVVKTKRGSCCTILKNLEFYRKPCASGKSFVSSADICRDKDGSNSTEEREVIEVVPTMDSRRNYGREKLTLHSKCTMCKTLIKLVVV